MPFRKVPAKDWTIEVDDGTGTSVWLPIGGLSSFTITRSAERADTTTFDTEGITSHLVTNRGMEVSLEGQYLEDPTDGTRDPGQARVETIAAAFGYDAETDFRFTSPGGDAQTITGTVTIEGPGGGNNDGATWTVTIQRTYVPA